MYSETLTLVFILTTSVSFLIIDTRAFQIGDESYINKPNSDANKCIVKIVSKYFHQNGFLTVALSKSEAEFDDSYIKKLFTTGKWSIMVKTLDGNVTGNMESIQTSNFYIIQVIDVPELDATLTHLTSLLSWNPHARFLVLLMNDVNTRHSDVVTAAFDIVWKRQAVNVVVMIPDPVEGLERLGLYTWYPYSLGHCEDRNQKPFKLGVCTRGKPRATLGLYPNKVPLNLNGCPVRVHVMHTPPYVIVPDWDKYSKINNGTTLLQQVNTQVEGLEMYLLQLIADTINVTLAVSTTPTADNAVTAAVAALTTASVDVAVGALAAETERRKVLDHTLPYLDDTITWCVPYAKRIPHWRNLIDLFQPITWLAVLGAYLIAVACTWAFGKCSETEAAAYKKLQDTALNVAPVFIGFAVIQLPKTGLVRFLMLLWIIFALHLDAAYQTSLISLLTNPRYETQIQTAEQLLNSDLKLGILKDDVPLFENIEQYRDLLQDRLVVCEDYDTCLRRVVSERDLGVAVSRVYMEFTAGQYRSKTTGQAQIYTFRTSVVQFPIEMATSKGFPLLERVNSVILRVTCSGLLEFTKKQFMRRYNADLASVERDVADVNVYEASDEEDSGVIALSLSHLQGAFYVLLIGLGTSAGVLIAEALLRIVNKRRL